MAILLWALGGQEFLIIAVVAAVVIFGAAKVPLFFRGVGQGIKEFKQAVRDDPGPSPPPAEAGDKPAEKSQQ